jgi:nucleoside phosphorylase
MTVLVIHDREKVAAQIEDLLRETVEGTVMIDVADDQRVAKVFLTDKIYDLVIVDLTIPFFKGKDEPTFQAADLLLRELFEYESFNVPGDVIGITRDDTALQAVENSLGPHLMVTIREDSVGLWKASLADKVRYAFRASRTRSISVNRHHDRDLLIMTAIDKELDPYRQRFELSPIPHFRGAYEFAFMAGGKARSGVAFSAGRSGQPPAASFAQALITMFRPRLALMSGYCGAVSTSDDPDKRKVKLGDLILVEASYAWDYGKWTEEKEGEETISVFRSRPEPIDVRNSPIHDLVREFMRSDFAKDPVLLAEVSRLSKGAVNDFAMHRGPLASGSAVVTNDRIVEQIRGLNEAMLGVDMESYGFYQAAETTRVVKPQFLCLKSASDFCNGEKGDDLHEACSFISASAAAWLIERWKFD